MTRTWIVYNKPKEPSYTHAGMLMGLGLTGGTLAEKQHSILHVYTLKFKEHAFFILSVPVIAAVCFLAGYCRETKLLEIQWVSCTTMSNAISLSLSWLTA